MLNYQKIHRKKKSDYNCMIIKKKRKVRTGEAAAPICVLFVTLVFLS